MLLKSPDTSATIPVHAVEITQNNRIFGTFPKISKNCAEMSRVKNDFNPKHFFVEISKADKIPTKRPTAIF